VSIIFILYPCILIFFPSYLDILNYLLFFYDISLKAYFYALDKVNGFYASATVNSIDRKLLLLRVWVRVVGIVMAGVLDLVITVPGSVSSDAPGRTIGGKLFCDFIILFYY